MEYRSTGSSASSPDGLVAQRTLLRRTRLLASPKFRRRANVLPSEPRLVPAFTLASVHRPIQPCKRARENHRGRSSQHPFPSFVRKPKTSSQSATHHRVTAIQHERTTILHMKMQLGAARPAAESARGLYHMSGYMAPLGLLLCGQDDRPYLTPTSRSGGMKGAKGGSGEGGRR